jgi:hypothetical protein
MDAATTTHDRGFTNDGSRGLQVRERSARYDIGLGPVVAHRWWRERQDRVTADERITVCHSRRKIDR